MKEKADLQSIERHLAAVLELLGEHPPLERVLFNPAVPVPRKRAAMAEVTTRMNTAPMVTKLLLLLAERDRLALIPDVVAAYHERLLDHQQVVRAEVTTAAPLADGRAKAIESSLARVTGRTVKLTRRVDAAIIGGVITRIGSTIYDGSIARQLEKMKERLSEA
jgi:F-type H+-transporting ATPase subunit delta